MTLKRTISQEELAKLSSFVIVVSSGDKFYLCSRKLHLIGPVFTTALSETIEVDSVEEAILKARVMFPNQVLIDVMTTYDSLGIRYERHFCDTMSFLKCGSVAYEIDI